MARLRKTEVARREAIKVRAEKAFASTTEAFGKLLRKHIPNIASGEGSARVDVRVEIGQDGQARMSMGYQMTVIDDLSFPLDDGQGDLPLEAETAEAAEAKAAPSILPEPQAPGMPEGEPAEAGD